MSFTCFDAYTVPVKKDWYKQASTLRSECECLTTHSGEFSTNCFGFSPKS